MGWQVYFPKYPILISLLSDSQLLTEDIPSFVTWLSKPSFMGDVSPIFFGPFSLSYHVLQSNDYLFLTFAPHFPLQDFCSCFPSTHRAPAFFVSLNPVLPSDFNFITICFIKSFLSLPTIHFSFFSLFLPPSLSLFWQQ